MLCEIVKFFYNIQKINFYYFQSINKHHENKLLGWKFSCAVVDICVNLTPHVSVASAIRKLVHWAS